MTRKYSYDEKLDIERWSISWMCKQRKLSRAAYYKWLHREIPKQRLANIELAGLINMPKISIIIQTKGKTQKNSFALS